MQWKISTFILLTAVAQSFSEDDDNPEAWNKNDKLRKHLLKNYDKHTLPHKKSDGTTEVFANMYPRAIWIDDDKEILVVNSWLALDWMDDRLQWDNKDFGELKEAHFGDEELWKPDISVFNNAEITEVDHYGDVHFLVFYSGWVWWYPPATMKTYCPLDLKFWPFDEHTCGIRLGSWTSHGMQINIRLYNNDTRVFFDVYKNMSSSWVVKKASQHRITEKYGGYDEYFIEIYYSFTLQRRSTLFTYCIVVPAIVLPLLLLFQFILPVDHEMRFTIGCGCAVFVLLELLFLKLSLPRIGGSTPLIVSYYSLCMVLCVLTLGITAFLGRLAHPQDPILDFPPPGFIKKIFSGPLSTVLCIRTTARSIDPIQKMQEGEDESTQLPSRFSSHGGEWLLIAKGADRIAIIVLTVIFIFSLIGYVAPVK